jgi:methionyl-tRNA formyltransferase
MRVFFVIDETRFYHPAFLDRILRFTKDMVVGAARVIEVPERHNIERYLIRNWRKLCLTEIASLTAQKYGGVLKEFLSKNGPPFYSVKAVLKHHNVPFFDVRGNINNRTYLDAIAGFAPDVIVSSNSLIFEDELLQIPKSCCLNRHSALLPSYGGLWPVFQAYRSGEAFVGASVHTMERRIDRGIVLSRKLVPVSHGETLASLYKKCFEASSVAVLESLDKVRVKDFSGVPGNFPASYFSFPTDEHWRQFRARGGRFV